MAKVNSGVQIIGYGDGVTDRVRIPIASATVIKKGDLISYESNKAVCMDAVTEDITFAGIAEDESADGETNDIVVLKICRILIPLASAAKAKIGDGLKYNAGSATASYKVEDDAGANTIMWVDRDYSSNTTKVEAVVNTVVLQKLYSSAP